MRFFIYAPFRIKYLNKKNIYYNLLLLHSIIYFSNSKTNASISSLVKLSYKISTNVSSAMP